MAKIVMEVEFDYETEWWHNDKKEKDWFFDQILRNSELWLFENTEIGEHLGQVRILNIKESE